MEQVGDCYGGEAAAARAEPLSPQNRDDDDDEDAFAF